MKCYRNGRFFLNKLKNIKENKEITGHFIIDDVYCRYNIFDKSKPLIITFNALVADMAAPTFRRVMKGNVYPWAFEYVSKLKLNIVSFMPIQAMNWYRSLEFHDFLKVMGPELSSFDVVRGYGGSMGAYAVSAFSEVLRMDEMLLINPISTLNRELVPFENREKFYRYNKYNWCESFFDGADTKVGGYIIYDPLFHLDVLHAKRYKYLKELRLPGVGHSMPMHLNRLGMLKWISTSFLVDGYIDEKRFYKEARNRRNYNGYYEWMLSEQNIHLTKNREKIINIHYKKFKKQIDKG